MILDRSAYAAWLDPSLDAEGARALLTIPAVADWVCEPVSTKVNSAQTDDASCIAPMSVPPPVQGDLFAK